MDLIIFEWQDFEERTKNDSNLKFPASTKYLSIKFNVKEALGYKAVSIFVDSRISNKDIDKLKAEGCEKILLRSAGFNMLDAEHAKKIGINVYRVASYSPESIAEFALTLMLALSRKLPLQRRLHDSGKNGRTIDSMGFTLRDKVLGLHGYGKIARELADIARNGLKMKVKYFDPFINSEVDEKVETIEELYANSDIVSIHVPLISETEGSVNKELLSKTKHGFILINTSRGPIVNSKDILEFLEEGKIFYGTDVWEQHDKFEKKLFTDRSIQTDHVAFFTEEAVNAILSQTLESYEGDPRAENIL